MRYNITSNTGILIGISSIILHQQHYAIYAYHYLTFFNLPRPATAATATVSRLRSQKLHIVLWGLHVGLVL